MTAKGQSIASATAVKSEPNVVPMIDVMLVLLIIFMVVTPLITSGFQATMPQGKNLVARPEDQDRDVTLGMDKFGNFYLNTKPFTEDKLEQTLTDIYSKRATDKILFFKGDKDLQYSQVERVVKIARKAGVRVLAAVTDERKELKKRQ
jgi:biopolymer transport protein TolR